jgi:hypothetical protein
MDLRITTIHQTLNVFDVRYEVPRVDEIEMIWRIYKLVFNIIDREFDVCWYPVWLNGTEIKTFHNCAGIHFTNCRFVSMAGEQDNVKALVEYKPSIAQIPVPVPRLHDS